MNFNIINTIKNYPKDFWILNFIYMLERLAFWCVLIQLPVYISQKDAVGGLHWEQTTKGFIFFVWALVQNIVPIFSGGYADNYGYKKTLIISFFGITIGYLLIGTQTNFYVFLIATIILGIGSGIFKPTIQGAISHTLIDKNSSVGWGINSMLINFAVLFGPPLTIYLKSFSWFAVFIGSVVIFSVNFILFVFCSNIKIQGHTINKPLFVLNKILKNLTKPWLIWFVILMSGFTIIYMQFYETLPNFIIDWSDTSEFVKTFNLPEFMTTNTNRGVMLAYEWVYTFSSLFILFFVVFISFIISKFKSISALIIGILIAACGLMFCGISMNGYFLLFGVILYTLGEMITNPQFINYMSKIAPIEDKSLFVSYINISWAIGLASGSLLGGYLYKHFGEKASLALNYYNTLNINEVTNNNINSANSFDFVSKYLNLSATEMTQLLWNNYQAYLVFIPFLILGIISAFGLMFYKKRYSKSL